MAAGQWGATARLWLITAGGPVLLPGEISPLHQSGRQRCSALFFSGMMIQRLFRPFLSIMVPLLLLSLLLGLPGDPGRLWAPAHLALAPELGLVLGLLALWARRVGPPGFGVILFLSLLTLPFVLLRLADLGAQLAAWRPLQPLFDPVLLPALWGVLAGSVGPIPLALLLCLILLGLIGLISLAYRRMVRPLATVEGRWLAGVLALGLPLLSLCGLPGAQPFSQGSVAAIIDQRERVAEGRRMQQALAAALTQDPVADIPAAQRFALLRGRPLVLIWVESYGLSALTDPRHGPLVSNRLALLEQRLTAKGFHMLSGLVDSPVLGGRSWLAHGTLRAGIRQEQPAQQVLVLAAGHVGLVAALQQAGWHTQAIMPGLSGPWPEGTLWGFDRVLNAGALGYQGPRYGWSPMPDQALFAALDATRPFAAGPTYLELVLTSSHAPWTPLPPWRDGAEGLADGSTYGPPDRPDYGGMAGAYAQSIDYSLRAAGDWLARSLPDDALVLMLGDHPALGWIADPTAAGHHVPLHILSKDGALMQPARSWGLVDGMLPAADSPAIPMENLLGLIAGSYSGPKPGGV
ncbi:Phosphoglycerol transferase MdoB [Azospirillum sp. RU38E]|nr:Phosphoglycerol transferase MdoB [Azospirillum sp. RU38E]SNS34509.1 Phosphoglycerol transferase MdoB [Azospirillum sp. RU37A]